MKWYILDHNAVPEEYQLRPLEDVNDKVYWEDYPKLLKALQDHEFEDGLLIGSSVTEYEVSSSIPF